MTYTENGDRVNLDMTADEFASLLQMCGYAAAAAHERDEIKIFWRWIGFANEINETNPRFKPYTIPEAYLHFEPLTLQAQTADRSSATNHSSPKKKIIVR